MKLERRVQKQIFRKKTVIILDYCILEMRFFDYPREKKFLNEVS